MRRLIALLAPVWLALSLFSAPAQAMTPGGWTVLGGCNPSVTKVIAITSGASYTIPADYCSPVEVDAIGEGGGGGSSAGNGGGGGGFAKLTGQVYTVGQVITIQIGAGSSATATCWISCATLKADYGRSAASGSAGGTVNVGTSSASGGAGAIAANGGGGGAAGPHGAGAAGSGSTGGTGDAGFGGTAGLPGAEYMLTAGGTAGSGGGGTGAAGGGGNYGAGGSGGPGIQPPNAAAGLIIFQYHPSY